MLVVLGTSVAIAPLAPVAEPVALLAPTDHHQINNDINNNTTAGGVTMGQCFSCVCCVLVWCVWVLVQCV